ncbi:uncharacterized protein LOC116663320 [Camelus ferus]|uniref:Uncharacterized protein LOC116663320 n=1 Tax=Camelus ferus TaxID=419612 RepID=A0A8B8SXP5_CAMFR|nr:uncharacterized protein LOC116663320 [Camelus ferus]
MALISSWGPEPRPLRTVPTPAPASTVAPTGRPGGTPGQKRSVGPGLPPTGLAWDTRGFHAFCCPGKSVGTQEVRRLCLPSLTLGEAGRTVWQGGTYGRMDATAPTAGTGRGRTAMGACPRERMQSPPEGAHGALCSVSQTSSRSAGNVMDGLDRSPCNPRRCGLPSLRATARRRVPTGRTSGSFRLKASQRQKGLWTALAVCLGSEIGPNHRSTGSSEGNFNQLKARGSLTSRWRRPQTLLRDFS